MSGRKINFFRTTFATADIASNLPLEIFRTTVANADIGSLKSLHTFFYKMYVRKQAETKSFGPNYSKF